MSEWISVEDRLPVIQEGKYAVSVITYVVDRACDVGNHVDPSSMFMDNKFQVYIGTDDEGRNHMTGEESSWCDYEYIGEHVTHWQPLPEPPS